VKLSNCPDCGRPPLLCCRCGDWSRGCECGAGGHTVYVAGKGYCPVAGRNLFHTAKYYCHRCQPWWNQIDVWYRIAFVATLALMAWIIL